MFDPEDPADIQRLWQAVESSRKELDPFRNKAYEFIRQYVGYHYSEQGTSDRKPINLMELATSIYSRHLVSQNPRAFATTPYQTLRTLAYNLALAVDKLIEDIDLGDTLDMVVKSAILTPLGIVKIALADQPPAEMMKEPLGFRHDVAQPYVDEVMLADWVHDMTATRWDQMTFCGNRYRIRYDYFMESAYYENKKDVQPTSIGSEAVDGVDEARPEFFSTEPGEGFDELEDHVELWDLWLPEPNVLLTIPAGGMHRQAVHTSEWLGPEKGPYKFLFFNRVPGNLMALAPAANWYDMDDMGNRLFNKLGRQAERQKMVLGYQGAAAKDAERVQSAGDGDIIAMGNPDAMKEFRFGGIDQANFAFFLQLRQLFSYFAGNLDALGGLGPQSETLGQDKLLQRSASIRIDDMQSRVTTFTRDVLRDLAWYLFYDPEIELPITKTYMGRDIQSVYRSADMEGDFLDYNIDIEPYSMQYQSPGEKLQKLMSVTQNLLLRGEQSMAQQQIAIDWMALIDEIATLANLPELKHLLIHSRQDTIQQPIGQPPAHMGGGDSTTTRINRPGATMQGQEAAMMQTLLGGQPQEAEMAAIGRPTG